MKNYFGLIINIVLINISFSQAPCILGSVYVSEAANQGDPDDYIEVVNGGNQECTLAGFQLDDTEDLEDFTFGNVILAPGNYWLGYEDAENSFNSGLSGSGDNVVFADADGNMLIVTLEESIETADGLELSQSYDSGGSGCYTMPTPGIANADCFVFVYGCTDPDATNYDADANVDDWSCEYSTVSCILGEVYVSEAANQGDPDDYIEVVNGGDQECTLAGFQLDDTEDLEDFTFGNVILAPDGYWHCFEDAEDCFRSGLDADGDLVVFADPGGNMLIVILAESLETLDGVELSQSYGSDGVGCYTMPTPGYINEPCFCLSSVGNLNADYEYVEDPVTGEIITTPIFNVLDIVILADCVLVENCGLNPDGSNAPEITGNEFIENGCAGDLNGDGVYNVLDIVILANCVLANNCGNG